MVSAMDVSRETAPDQGKPAELAPSERNLFKRKYSDELANAVRFNYIGVSSTKVAQITGANVHWVREVRKGRRRVLHKAGIKGPADFYRHMRGNQFRLFFIDKVVKLLDVYFERYKELERTGDYTDIEPGELNVQSSAERAALNPVAVENIRRYNADVAAGRRKPAGRRVAEGEGVGGTIAGNPAGPAGGSPVHQQGPGTGAGGTRVPGLFYD